MSLIAVHYAYERLTKFRDQPDSPPTEIVFARPKPKPPTPPLDDLRPISRPATRPVTLSTWGVDLRVEWGSEKRVIGPKRTKVIQTRGSASIRSGITIDTTTITSDTPVDEDEFHWLT